MHVAPVATAHHTNCSTYLPFWPPQPPPWPLHNHAHASYDSAHRESLQGQLRAQLLEQLRQLAGPGAPLRSCAGGDQGSGQPGGPPGSMWAAAAACIVADHLAAQGWQFALSVLRAEAELPARPSFSRSDLTALLRLEDRPGVSDAMAAMARSSNEGGGALPRDAAQRVCPALAILLLLSPPPVLLLLACWAHPCAATVVTD